MTPVRQEILLEAVTDAERPLAVAAELRYLPDDPYAVRLALPVEAVPGAAVRAFPRDLLGAGLGTPTGLGGVLIRPLAGGWTQLGLLGPEGVTLLRARTAELLRFLDRTYAAVPAGSERRQRRADPPRVPLLAGT
ncbi:SsgA family sporulation/cell division regulator [Streptomyces capparidis]